MKKLIFLLTCFLVMMSVNAQILKTLGEKAKAKIGQRANQKVDNAMDKGLDEIEGKGTGKLKSKGSPEADAEVKGEALNLKAFSNYDFVPGSKIVYAEDFSQDVVGEFPLKWNTNGSGEVVTFEKIPGKWLQLMESTKYTAPYKGKLPENYTIEFDLLVDFKEDQSVGGIKFKLFNEQGKSEMYAASIEMRPNGGSHTSQGEQLSADRIRFTSWDNKSSVHMEAKDQLIGVFTKYNKRLTPVHVSIWVQKERMRAWINQQKVYDLPKAIPPVAFADKVGFEVGQYGGPATNYQYFVSNLKVAVAPPDTRSKFITEGKWSTTGILFDVNSDKIKPTSYGVLKEIATMLNEAPDANVQIVGHTDSDGDDAKNMDLSKRRAASVKSILSSEFKVDASRMQTTGMGESKPITDNKTAEAKANNRRVDFIKL